MRAVVYRSRVEKSQGPNGTFGGPKGWGNGPDRPRVNHTIPRKKLEPRSGAVRNTEGARLLARRPVEIHAVCDFWLFYGLRSLHAHAQLVRFERVRRPHQHGRALPWNQAPRQQCGPCSRARETCRQDCQVRANGAVHASHNRERDARSAWWDIKESEYLGE